MDRLKCVSFASLALTFALALATTCGADAQPSAPRTIPVSGFSLTIGETSPRPIALRGLSLTVGVPTPTPIALRGLSLTVGMSTSSPIAVTGFFLRVGIPRSVATTAPIVPENRAIPALPTLPKGH